jgi:hypothetical protein
MVNHHTSLHPHGISAPVSVSFPEKWNNQKGFNDMVSSVGLADSLIKTMSGEIMSGREFVDCWESRSVASYADGPTWHLESLYDRYGESHPKIDKLEIRKVGIMSEGSQTVYSCLWNDNQIKTNI